MTKYYRILWIAFGTAFASYLLIPFLAIYLHVTLDMSFSEVSVCLMLKLAAQRFGGLLNLFFFSRLANATVFLLGILTRLFALLLLYYAEYLLQLSCAMLLFGLSSAVYVPSTKALLLSYSGLSTTLSALSTLTIVRTVGVATGALLGSWVISDSYLVIVVLSALIYLLCLLLFLSVSITEIEFRIQEMESPHHHVKAVVKGFYPRLFFPACIFGVAYAQLEFAIPIYVESAFGEKWIGFLFAVNTLTIITCQSFLRKFVLEYIGSEQLQTLGSIFIIGMLVIGAVSTGPLFIMLSLFVFTLAEMILLINFDHVIAKCLPMKQFLLGFSCTEIAIGIGTLLGYIITSLVYSAYPAEIGFFINNIIAAVVILGLLLKHRYF